VYAPNDPFCCREIKPRILALGSDQSQYSTETCFSLARTCLMHEHLQDGASRMSDLGIKLQIWQADHPLFTCPYLVRTVRIEACPGTPPNPASYESSTRCLAALGRRRSSCTEASIRYY